MGRSNSRRSTLLTAAALSAVAGGLSVAPPAVQQALRAAVLDFVVSGQSFAIDHLDKWRAAEVAVPAGPPAERTEVAAKPENDQRRASRTDLPPAAAGKRPPSRGIAPGRNVRRFTHPRSQCASAGAPSVVRAAVVSRQTLSQWQSVRHLNQGRARGITESSIVLEENLPHLDQGSEAGVESEFDVFIGRCVVGRIASVGRWTSTLEPITDPHYRALAQIVRPTDQGGTFGTEGILVGQGNGLCKLTEVPTTETVRVGDEVYTSDRDGRLPIPFVLRTSQNRRGGRPPLGHHRRPGREDGRPEIGRRAQTAAELCPTVGRMNGPVMKFVLRRDADRTALPCSSRFVGPLLGGATLRAEVLCFPVVAAVIACPGVAGCGSCRSRRTGLRLSGGGRRGTADGRFRARRRCSQFDDEPKSAVGIFVLSFVCAAGLETAIAAIRSAQSGFPLSHLPSAVDMAVPAVVTAIVMSGLCLAVRQLTRPFARRPLDGGRFVSIGWQRTAD